MLPFAPVHTELNNPPLPKVIPQGKKILLYSSHIITIFCSFIYSWDSRRYENAPAKTVRIDVIIIIILFVETIDFGPEGEYDPFEGVDDRDIDSVHNFRLHYLANDDNHSISSDKKYYAI